MTYELLAYLSVRATQIGMKACEIPVTRAYPKTGKTPTKISFFKGNKITILKSTGVLIIIAGVVSMAGCDEEHFRACSYNNGHLHIS